MNKYMSWFFRFVPLFMGAFCLSFGLYVTLSGASFSNAFILSGHVLIALTAICIALYCTAATIIRQLMKQYSPFWEIFLPLLGYAVSITTTITGFLFWYLHPFSSVAFVSGNIIFGVGLVACCVSTVATASTRFTLIPSNSANLMEGEATKGAFSHNSAILLIAIPSICAFICLIRAAILLFYGSIIEHYVAGHILLGLGLICIALIALVATVVRQVQNTFTDHERFRFTYLVLGCGTLNLLLGLFILVTLKNSAYIAPGWVLIGLGLICYSIVSKVFLLASVWRRDYPLAKRIPLIPVLTTLLCLFIAAFLFNAATFNVAFIVPARVMSGLGAVCFTLFSIVSILESGTSK